MPINFRRLRKLAKHIRSGKLGHDEFDFMVVNRDYSGGNNHPIGKTCGTNGCAMGELPILYPSLWEFNNDDVRLKGSKGRASQTDVKQFFGINDKQLQHLFVPVPYYHTEDEIEKRLKKYGGERLGYGATRKQVADNMDIFIKKMSEKGKKK